MVMDGACEQIYRFSEIIFSSNYAAQGSSSGSENSNSSNDDVYVLFEQHYGDLHSFMKEKKRLEENEARLIFRQCVEAVQSCHDNGIIIRDIKLKKFVFLDEQRSVSTAHSTILMCYNYINLYFIYICLERKLVWLILKIASFWRKTQRTT